MPTLRHRLLGTAMRVRELDRRSATEAVALAQVFKHKDARGDIAIDYVRAFREANRQRREALHDLVYSLKDVQFGGDFDA